MDGKISSKNQDGDPSRGVSLNVLFSVQYDYEHTKNGLPHTRRTSPSLVVVGFVVVVVGFVGGFGAIHRRRRIWLFSTSSSEPYRGYIYNTSYVLYIYIYIYERKNENERVKEE